MDLTPLFPECAEQPSSSPSTKLLKNAKVWRFDEFSDVEAVFLELQSFTENFDLRRRGRICQNIVECLQGRLSTTHTVNELFFCDELASSAIDLHTKLRDEILHVLRERRLKFAAWVNNESEKCKQKQSLEENSQFDEFQCLEEQKNIIKDNLRVRFWEISRNLEKKADNWIFDKASDFVLIRTSEVLSDALNLHERLTSLKKIDYDDGFLPEKVALPHQLVALFEEEAKLLEFEVLAKLSREFLRAWRVLLYRLSMRKLAIFIEDSFKLGAFSNQAHQPAAEAFASLNSNDHSKDSSLFSWLTLPKYARKPTCPPLDEMFGEYYPSRRAYEGEFSCGVSLKKKGEEQRESGKVEGFSEDKRETRKSAISNDEKSLASASLLDSSPSSLHTHDSAAANTDFSRVKTPTNSSQQETLDALSDSFHLLLEKTSNYMIQNDIWTCFFPFSYDDGAEDARKLKKTLKTEVSNHLLRCGEIALEGLRKYLDSTPFQMCVGEVLKGALQARVLLKLIQFGSSWSEKDEEEEKVASSECSLNEEKLRFDPSQMRFPASSPHELSFMHSMLRQISLMPSLENVIDYEKYADACFACESEEMRVFNSVEDESFSPLASSPPSHSHALYDAPIASEGFAAVCNEKKLVDLPVSVLYLDDKKAETASADSLPPKLISMLNEGNKVLSSSFSSFEKTSKLYLSAFEYLRRNWGRIWHFFSSGKFHVLDVLIREETGIIIALLDNDEKMRKYVDHEGKVADSLDLSRCKVYDFSGLYVLPGLQDSHLHVAGSGSMRDYVNLFGITSVEGIISRLKEDAQADSEASGLLVGFGWNEKNFANPGIPTRRDLDEVFKFRRVALYRGCFHAMVCNTAMMLSCDLDPHKVDEWLKRAVTPSSSADEVATKIGRFEDGSSNGMFKEDTIFSLLKFSMTMYTTEAKKGYIERELKFLCANGVTAVHTCDQDSTEAYFELELEQRLPIRVFHTMYFEDLQEALCKVVCLEEAAGSLPSSFQKKYSLEDLLKFTSDKSVEQLQSLLSGVLHDCFKRRGSSKKHASSMFSCERVKLFADGSIGARTAALNRPYKAKAGVSSDTSKSLHAKPEIVDGEEAETPKTVGCRCSQRYGVLLETKHSLLAKLRIIKNCGLRVEVHIIGDAAADMVLDGFIEAGIYDDSTDRPVLNHCTLVDSQSLEKMKKTSSIASIQPSFVSNDAPGLSSVLDPKTVPNAHRWKTMLDFGIVCAGGSDHPVESPNPLKGMFDAIYRPCRTYKPRSMLEGLKYYRENVAHTPRQRGSAGQEEFEEAKLTPFSECKIYNEAECVSFEEALKMYTKGAAYACMRSSYWAKERSEIFIGEIEAGAAADFTVLDIDPSSDTFSSLLRARVKETWVAGRRVFKNPYV